jgi:hypothetical protein
VLSALLVTSAARADERDNAAAEALFRTAREAMASGDYASACVRFAESHRLDPAAGTLLNLAQCEEKLGKVATARAHAVEALERLPKDDFRIPFAQKMIASLEKRSPSVTVRLKDPSNPEVHVERDGVVLGVGSFGVALPTDPGPHVFTLHAGDQEVERHEVQLQEGEEVTVEFTSVPERTRLGGSSRSAPDKGEGSGKRTLAWISIATGGLGLTGFMTASAASTYKEHCKDATCDAEGRAAASLGKVTEVVSPVAFGVGLLGIGLGTYLLVSSKGRSPGAAQVTLSPQLSLPGAGMTVSGVF